MAQVEQERVEFRTNVSGRYTFAVKSFSDLSEILSSGAESYESPEFAESYESPEFAESYESPEFQFGGQKWTLSLYPNGDTGCGGHGHISLYLNMVDATGSYGSGIRVSYKMLVWDQIRDEFLAVQDCKVRRFHSLKKQWGFTRLMSLATFKDSQNGYLVDDCCLFGIELMIVVSPDVRLGCLSIVKKPADGTFKWTLDKFSTLKEHYYDSDPFTVESQQWKLRVYPNGNSSEKGSCLSVFLLAHDVMYHRGSKVYVDATVRLKDHLCRQDHEISFQHWIGESGDWGWNAFLPLTDLKDKARGFLIDDSLVFEVSVNAISNTTEAKMTPKERPTIFKTQVSNFRQLRSL